MDLTDLIAPEAVFPALKAKTKKQALEELAQRAARLTGLDGRDILETLLQRERLGSTDAAYLTIGTTFLFRVLTIQFNWSSRAVMQYGPPPPPGMASSPPYPPCTPRRRCPRTRAASRTITDPSGRQLPFRPIP